MRKRNLIIGTLGAMAMAGAALAGAKPLLGVKATASQIIGSLGEETAYSTASTTGLRFQVNNTSGLDFDYTLELTDANSGTTIGTTAYGSGIWDDGVGLAHWRDVFHIAAGEAGTVTVPWNIVYSSYGTANNLPWDGSAPSSLDPNITINLTADGEITDNSIFSNFELINGTIEADEAAYSTFASTVVEGTSVRMAKTYENFSKAPRVDFSNLSIDFGVAGIGFYMKNPSAQPFKFRIYSTASNNKLYVPSTTYHYALVSNDGTVSKQTANRNTTVPAGFEGVVVMSTKDIFTDNVSGNANLDNCNHNGLTLTKITFYSGADAAAQVMIGKDVQLYGYDRSLRVVENALPFSKATVAGVTDCAAPTIKQMVGVAVTPTVTVNGEAGDASLINYNDTLSPYDTLVVTAVDDYTIISAEIDGQALNANSDGSFSLLLRDGVTTGNLVVALSQASVYVLTVNYNSSQVDVTVNGEPYTAAKNFEDGTQAVVVATPKDGFGIDAIYLDDELVESLPALSMTDNHIIRIESSMAHDTFVPGTDAIPLESSSILYKSNYTGTAANKGGRFLAVKPGEVTGTKAFGFRMKNFRNSEVEFDTVYIGCSGNHDFSLVNSTSRLISIDGTATTTTSSRMRGLMLPARFDGYVFFDYPDLVSVRDGGSWIWTRRDADKFGENESLWPTGQIHDLALYFRSYDDNSDVYVGIGDEFLTQKKDGTYLKYDGVFSSSSLSGMAAEVAVSAFPAYNSTIQCDNNNVTVTASTLRFGDNFAVVPDEGYSIASATLNGVALPVGDDGAIHYQNFLTNLGENVELHVETTREVYYSLSVNYDATHLQILVDGEPYTGALRLAENATVTVSYIINAGFEFVGAELDGQSVYFPPAGLEVTMDGNHALTINTRVQGNAFVPGTDESALTSEAIVLNPLNYEGSDRNRGGRLIAQKQPSLVGKGFGFRIKNLSYSEYDIDTVYLAGTENWEYSLYNSVTTLISVDGTTVTTTSSTCARGIHLPARFDGYAFVPYSELVEVRTGGSYDWSKRAADKIPEERFPSKNLANLAIYLPKNADNSGNQLVIGEDFYIQNADDSYTVYDNIFVPSAHNFVSEVEVKGYPTFSTAISCDNENVTLSTDHLEYGDRVVISPKPGYVITGATFGGALPIRDDGTVVYQAFDDLGESAVFHVETARAVRVHFDYNPNEVEISCDDDLVFTGEETSYAFTVTPKTGYEVVSVKAGDVELQKNEQGQYVLPLEGDVTVTIVARAQSFTITYDLDGGTNNPNNPTSVTAADSFTLLDPTKEGYTFLGWYDDDGNEVLRISHLDHDITLHARWEKNEEPVDPDPGTSETPVTPDPDKPADSGKKGCGGAVLATAISAAVALAGIVVIAAKKKKDE